MVIYWINDLHERMFYLNDKKYGITVLVILITLAVGAEIAAASNQVSMTPEINIEHECDESEAELTIRIFIPKGTSISTMPDLIERLLSFYKGLWTGTDPIIGRIMTSGKNPTPVEIGDSTHAILGVDAIMSISRAYRSVEERGFSIFPEDVTVISIEKFPLVFECLIDGNANSSKDNEESRVQQYTDNNLNRLKKRKLVSNLNMVSAALVSFRSQHSRFPKDIQELISSGHQLLFPVNPFTNEVLKLAGANGIGTIKYAIPSEGRFILTVFDDLNLPIRREFFAGPDNSVRGVLSNTVPTVGPDAASYSSKEQIVRIYIFQIDQLINSFYETYQYLPRKIPHIEGQGFALVDYINPFTNQPISPIHRMNEGQPGLYWYWIVNSNEYLLVAYGVGGRKVIEIHRKIVGNI